MYFNYFHSACISSVHQHSSAHPSAIPPLCTDSRRYRSSGPYDKRVLTPVTMVTFTDRDLAKAVLDRSTALKPKLGGTDLKIGWARTKKQEKRNYALRESEKLIGKHAAAQGKAVNLDMKERKVTVDGVDAFTQSKADRTGLFKPPFSDLKVVF